MHLILVCLIYDFAICIFVRHNSACNNRMCVVLLLLIIQVLGYIKFKSVEKTLGKNVTHLYYKILYSIKNRTFLIHINLFAYL